MNQWKQDMLHLNPRSDEVLRDIVAGFEQKWQKKARRHITDRASLL